jgi:dynein intermediate chain 2
MTDAFTYQKPRQEFGRHPNFGDTETTIIGFVEQEPNVRKTFTLQDPKVLVLDNIPQFSEHSVNTERVATKNKGMKHIEGGWPDGIDPTEPPEVAKYKKKLDRDQNLGFAPAVKSTAEEAINCISQNNEIDQFEEYFPGEIPDHHSETVNTKTLMLFKDPNEIKRAVSKITWHPDTSSLRLAACYSILRFQQMPKNMPLESYIWNLSNPNEPEVTLLPPSALCTLAFNHKNSDILVGGSYNGSLSFFDLREGNSDGHCYPTTTTLLEKSHHDPVYDIFWLTHGKTGDELVSASTDGRLLWWDKKKLDAGPIDELIVNEVVAGSDVSKILGVTRIEYNVDSGPLKYLVGTEQGYIFQANKRPGRQVEVNQKYGLLGGKHHGPIYSLQRNPHITKYFMSVGDWTAKMWSEDVKTPIMQTKYHDSYLTDGCWSPQRPGLFYLTRMDGFIDIWDFFYRQNEVAYSQKVSDNPLTCISIQGPRMAIGDSEGAITLMQIPQSLYEPQPNEKDEMVKIFDREAAREKNLEMARKQADTKKPAKTGEVDHEEKRKKELEQELINIEEMFYKTVGMSEGDIGAMAEHHQEEEKQEEPEEQQEEQQEEPQRDEPQNYGQEEQQESEHNQDDQQDDDRNDGEEGDHEDQYQAQHMDHHENYGQGMDQDAEGEGNLGEGDEPSQHEDEGEHQSHHENEAHHPEQMEGLHASDNGEGENFDANSQDKQDDQE